jgi:hypothetical protein
VSPHNEGTLVKLSTSGFTVRTRKIVVRVSGATTGCGVTREGLAAAAVVIEPASGIRDALISDRKSALAFRIDCDFEVGGLRFRFARIVRVINEIFQS